MWEKQEGFLEKLASDGPLQISPDRDEIKSIQGGDAPTAKPSNEKRPERIGKWQRDFSG